MMDLIYSQSPHPAGAGRAFRNPRFFKGAEEGVKSVIVIGNWPAIVGAYSFAGVPVEEHGAAPVSKAVAPPPPELHQAAPVDERSSVFIPEDWRDLPYGRPTEDRDLTMRGIARMLSDEPVMNKAQAEAAIEAELARRGE